MVQQSTLSASARGILEAAAHRIDRITFPPVRLPVAARRSVVRSLLKAGLIEEVQADDGQVEWRTGEDGSRHVLRATGAGLRAVGREEANDEQYSAGSGQEAPSAAETKGEAPSMLPLTTAGQTSAAVPLTANSRFTIRTAAQRVVTAWDNPDADRPALPHAVEALRTALSQSGRELASGHRQPRRDTKRATVLALLRRPEGGTVAQVADATGWATHTVRGFFASLKKQGLLVEVLERVRQVGPGKQGAAGSYTVYRVVEAG